jgi:hypothetical protein
MAESFDSRSADSFRKHAEKRKRDDGENVLMGYGASKFVIGKRTKGVEEDEQNIVNIFPQTVVSGDSNLLPGTIHIPSPIHVANLSPIKSPQNLDNASIGTSPSYTSLTRVEMTPNAETENLVQQISQAHNVQPVFKLNLQQLHDSPILSMPSNLSLPDSPVKNSDTGHISMALSAQDL